MKQNICRGCICYVSDSNDKILHTPLLTDRVALIIEFNRSLTGLHLQLTFEIVTIPVGTTLFAVRAKGILTFHTRKNTFDL